VDTLDNKYQIEQLLGKGGMGAIYRATHLGTKRTVAVKVIVRDHIKPKQIIAVHVSPPNAEKVAAQLKQAFPGAVAFTTMLEKKQY
jgi:serine/threonine protein kinase